MTVSTTNASSVYENRFIAFIDILGFRSIISDTVTDPALATRIQSVLSHIVDLKTDNDTGILSLKDTGKELSVFSDSIVISYPADNTSPLFYLLMDVIHLQLEMMNVGIMLRGGIAYGQLFHKDGVVFGPAMIDAYDLESKNAIYPRVLIDTSAITAGIQLGIHGPAEEWQQIAELTEEDEDHQIFVDFMSQYEELEDTVTYVVALETTKNLIEQSLNTNTNPNVLLKYLWLKRYFNKSLDKLKPKYSNGLYIE